MCLPAEPGDKSYSDIVKLMDNHFKPVISVFACREKFFEARKVPQESPKEFAARLGSLVAVCQFEGSEEIGKALVNRFIIGYEAGSVKDRLYEEKKSVSFEKVVEIASSKAAVQPYFHSVGNLIKKEPEIFYSKSQSKGSTQAHHTSHPSTSRNTGSGGRNGRGPHQHRMSNAQFVDEGTISQISVLIENVFVMIVIKKDTWHQCVRIGKK
ncbi:hypothetical protein NQ314_018199 [Rhamnusium bicolor]|uniref:FRIGIDA-like protein n=1 Tax=Rhamnusium bicolor TaxID=1586634 RepID=A0AAV8WRK2_9CUCU|nr:hypothetical protein NQ314_018199 [Rhamnusium bicolor]